MTRRHFKFGTWTGLYSRHEVLKVFGSILDRTFPNLKKTYVYWVPMGRIKLNMGINQPWSL